MGAAAGPALAALLFSLGKSLIALYIAHSGLTSPFGAAGSLVVLMQWAYDAALTFLPGAELRRAGMAVDGWPRTAHTAPP